MDLKGRVEKIMKRGKKENGTGSKLEKERREELEEEEEENNHKKNG